MQDYGVKYSGGRLVNCSGFHLLGMVLARKMLKYRCSDSQASTAFVLRQCSLEFVAFPPSSTGNVHHCAA